MAIALRKQAETAANDASSSSGVSYSDAIKDRLTLERRKAAVRRTGQDLSEDTEAQPNLKSLRDKIMPVWIGRSEQPAPRLSLQPLQEWEGYVIEIGAETFSARLVDLTAGQTLEQEVADFPLSDLSEDDRKLLQVGAIFRWVIGYQRSPGGTKRRVSQVVFRRMPAWTKRDFDSAKQRAARLFEDIAWE
ncbi:hypothetical protein J2X36_003214 [Methylobacterium sp. BE186]|uniref:hypothetical protein n=1 Tax=Methylobacterium sp. BE186 TaxID=2817715 RepID=UPI0028559B83|nr:hypothetical protein [Methylobacterium sp. BE186]MDR7038450.1 hypothetical protein [Methylobacterium sp. BE186]